MNKVLAFFKTHKIFTGILILFLLVWFCYSPPIKPTNPSNPLFVESWFRIRDYSGTALQRTLPKLFPMGTPKAYVDLMLVERGGASATDQTMFVHGKYAYIYQPISLWFTPDAWRIDVYYSPDNKVEALNFGHEFIVNERYKPQDAVKNNDGVKIK